MIDWDELMRREGSAVWRTAYRLLRNRADADECFQETFLAALEVANRQPVRNWPALLQRLATSRAIDRVRKRLRRQRREEVADLALVEAAYGDPSQEAEAAELTRSSFKTVGDCPNFSESARKNGTVPLSETVLKLLLAPCGGQSHSFPRGKRRCFVCTSWGIGVALSNNSKKSTSHCASTTLQTASSRIYSTRPIGVISKLPISWGCHRMPWA